MNVNTSINSQRILIVGGSSGLGLAFARALRPTNTVIVTGRTKPKHLEGEKELEFHHLELGEYSQLAKIEGFIEKLSHVDIVIFSPGGAYKQELLAYMRPSEAIKVVNVYFLAPVLLLGQILFRQKYLSGLINISSISQDNPPPKEALYGGAKAGLRTVIEGQYSTKKINKILVIGPSRISDNGDGAHNAGEMGKLNRGWVVEKTLEAYNNNDFKYQELVLPRNPARVEIKNYRK